MMASASSMMLKQRITAAIRGAFIADAASMGTHWIYDPTEMLKSVPDVQKPEFKDPPTPSFYSSEEFPGHYEKGMLSPYGEQLLFVTEYVAEKVMIGNKDDINGKDMSIAMLEWANTFGGRPDSALKTFIDNMNKDDQSGQWPVCGADDSQAHIYMKIVPVTCGFAGSPNLIEKVKEAIMVHQNNQKAIAFGIASARLLEAVLLGAPLDEALATIEQNLDEELKESEFKNDVIDAFARGKKAGQEDKTLDEILKEVSMEIMKDQPESNFYTLAGRSCALPGSFIGPIALFYKYCKSQSNNESSNWFATALRENILASGDTCSRAIFIGSILAASAVNNNNNNTPEDVIPSDWSEKMDQTTMTKVEQSIAMITKPLD